MAVLTFPAGSPYTPQVETRWDAQRAEYQINRFAFLGDVPKAVILGLTLACMAPFVALAMVVAVLAWPVDMILRRAR